MVNGEQADINSVDSMSNTNCKLFCKAMQQFENLDKNNKINWDWGSTSQNHFG